MTKRLLKEVLAEKSSKDAEAARHEETRSRTKKRKTSHAETNVAMLLDEDDTVSSDVTTDPDMEVILDNIKKLKRTARPLKKLVAEVKEDMTTFIEGNNERVTKLATRLGEVKEEVYAQMEQREAKLKEDTDRKFTNVKSRILRGAKETQERIGAQEDDMLKVKDDIARMADALKLLQAENDDLRKRLSAVEKAGKQPLTRTASAPASTTATTPFVPVQGNPLKYHLPVCPPENSSPEDIRKYVSELSKWVCSNTNGLAKVHVHLAAARADRDVIRDATRESVKRIIIGMNQRIQGVKQICTKTATTSRMLWRSDIRDATDVLLHRITALEHRNRNQAAAQSRPPPAPFFLPHFEAGTAPNSGLQSTEASRRLLEILGKQSKGQTIDLTKSQSNQAASTLAQPQTRAPAPSSSTSSSSSTSTESILALFSGNGNKP